MDVACCDVGRLGRRTCGVEVGDDVGVVKGDGAGYSGGLHKVVVRDVQQPVRDVTSVVISLVDSLGQVEGGQKIH